MSDPGPPIPCAGCSEPVWGAADDNPYHIECEPMECYSCGYEGPRDGHDEAACERRERRL